MVGLWWMGLVDWLVMGGVCGDWLVGDEPAASRVTVWIWEKGGKFYY